MTRGWGRLRKLAKKSTGDESIALKHDKSNRATSKKHGSCFIIISIRSIYIEQVLYKYTLLRRDNKTPKSGT